MDVHGYIDDLGRAGDFDSSDRFSLDPEAALRKYGDLLKAHPTLHILKLIQAGVAHGAAAIDVYNHGDRVEVCWRLDDHCPQLAALVQPAAPCPDRLRLALQLSACSQPQRLQLAYGSPQLSWRRTLGGARERLDEPEFSHFRVTLFRPRKTLWQRLLPTAALHNELAGRCAFAPVPVRLNGNVLNRPNFSKLPGLPRDVMPRGQLLERNQFDSLYPTIAALVQLAPSEQPAIAVLPPLTAAAAVTQVHGSSLLFENRESARGIGLVRWSTTDGALKVQSVRETRQNVGWAMPYNVSAGAVPGRGDLWLHTAHPGTDQFVSHYIADGECYHLRLGGLQASKVSPLFQEYRRYSAASALYTSSLLNARKVLLMRPLPIPESLIYFVDQGIVLNPLRVQLGQLGMVAMLNSSQLMVDASLLSPVYDERCQQQCHAAAEEYGQLCNSIRRMITGISALNLPHSTTLLWREALALREQAPWRARGVRRDRT